MICPKCGNQVRDGVQFCPNCGSRQDAAAQPQQQAAQPQQQAAQPQANAGNQVTPYAQQAQAYGTAGQKAKQGNSKGLAIGGMVCGIVGLLFCFLPTGILSLIVSIVGVVLSAMAMRRGAGGMAIAGLVCSIIALFIWFIVVACVGSLACGAAGLAASLS